MKETLDVEKGTFASVCYTNKSHFEGSRPGNLLIRHLLAFMSFQTFIGFWLA